MIFVPFDKKPKVTRARYFRVRVTFGFFLQFYKFQKSGKTESNARGLLTVEDSSVRSVSSEKMRKKAESFSAKAVPAQSKKLKLTGHYYFDVFYEF